MHRDATIVTCTALVVCSLGAATMLAARKRNGITPHGLNSYNRHRYGAYRPSAVTVLPESIRAVFQDGRRYIMNAIYKDFGCKIQLFHGVFST